MSTIEVSNQGGVAVLTLNRPAQRNAMSDDLVHRMLGAISDLDADPHVRVLVIAGSGRGFCAGSDLSELAVASAAGRSAFEAASGRLARQLGQMSKPVIAAVHGFAIGGGLTLAAACDVVIADASSKWGLPETPIGLFPAWGLNALVERIGKPAARRLAWGIDTLSGEEALMIGLVDQVAEDVLAEAMKVANRLADLPEIQSACVKEYFSVDHTGEAADLIANRLFLRSTVTPEARASFDRFRPGGAV